LGSIQKKRRGFRKLKRYRKLVKDFAADLKFTEAFQSDLEFFCAFDDLARQYGYDILKPKDVKSLQQNPLRDGSSFGIYC
jgi:hypothetical protein